MTTKLVPTWSIPAALAVALVCGTLGCGDDEAGDVDASTIPDSGPDASTSNYECPTEQPSGYTCVRGQVRAFVTNEPISISAGTKIGMYTALNNGDYPNEPVIEVDVQPDGRFLFPSIEQHLVQEYRYGDNGGLMTTYHLFMLRMDDQIAGYRLADNRYGMDFYDTELTFYVFADTTIQAWELSWANTITWDQVLGLDINHKTLVGLCYGSYPYSAPPTIDVTANLGTLVADLTGPFPELIAVGIESNRLDISNPFDYTGVMLAVLRHELPEDAPIYFSCDYYSSEFPTLGKLGPDEFDDGESFVVVHGPMLKNVPY